MMVSVGICLRRWHRTVRRWLMSPKVHLLAQTTGLVAGGFCLSAASLGNFAQPLTLALMMSLSGWPAVLIACGGALGYAFFWHAAGKQAVLWLCIGLAPTLLLSRRPTVLDTPWLMPSMAGVIVAGTGLAFQLMFQQTAPIAIYLLQIGLAILATRLVGALKHHRDPVLEWIACGAVALALAQIRPFPYLGAGYLAAGILAAAGAFPAAALSGLALDLAQVTRTPMAAVLCLAWLLRLIPGMKKWQTGALSGLVYIAVMYFCGFWDLQPLPGLLLGGLLGIYLPQTATISRRRGDTGFAQVRLEMASAVLRQTEQALSDVENFPIDEQALMARAAERACGSCPCRKNCKEEPAKMSTALLHKPLGNGADLPLTCRKSGRLLQEIRRSQEQLRAIRADRDRQEEYRAAVTQQYRFLSEYLQELSDALSKRSTPRQPIYQPEVAVCSASRSNHSGDRCFWFAGTECRYYILLCDGMGTGIDAARDGKMAGNMLKKLLSAGYPPEYALRSVNSFCALQGRAGAVTMDLAEIRLDTGRAAVYKWGAAPSYLTHRGETIKIGTATPPPGLSVTDARETVQELSLRKGETLILLSDGAEGEESLRAALEGTEHTPGEMAARILEFSRGAETDDATVAVVRLSALPTST